nr:putative ribonuclease H-like domain-containing protein [Tanacetum cinerariifolium]
GFQDTKKAREEGTQTYVLFPMLSDGSINPKNNKDVHTDGKEYDNDVQKSLSLDFHSSSCGDQTRKQCDKAENKDKDLPYGKREIGTKWVYRNKKDKRGIVIRNKARLVTQGHTQEEGINYEEVFAPVARIKAIKFFLAYASFMGFPVYQMDVKSAFLYGTIGEEVYVCQPPGFEDPEYPDKVYKVVKALYGLHQAPRAWIAASTPIDAEKPLLKDSDGKDVDVHTYRSMIVSLMYLTSSRPDIIFAVCACARFQVTLKLSHLNADKRIFRYLKGKPCLSLWYPKDSPFDLVAYSDSNYAVIATSSIEAEYVTAASGCAQVPWMQNQLLDYG